MGGNRLVMRPIRQSVPDVGLWSTSADSTCWFQVPKLKCTFFPRHTTHFLGRVSVFRILPAVFVVFFFASGVLECWVCRTDVAGEANRKIRRIQKRPADVPARC